MQTTSPQSFVFGPFRLEPAEGRLLRDGELVRLPPKALGMLVLLVTRAGKLVTKEELLAEVWAGTFVEEGNLTVNMTTLRRALGDEGAFIETVPKRGYRFIAVVTPSAPAEVQSLRPVIQQAPVARRSLPLLSVLVIGAATVVLGGWLWLRPAAAADIKSLLVLPFQTTADPAQGYLEIGMAEALNARIAGVGSVRVPPMAAVRAGEDPFDAGTRLGVDAVLTGSVQKVGERLRVTAQLSRVRDRRLVWSSSFDEKFTDVFVLQDRLAARIASSVTTNLTATDRAALTRHETKNPAAYDLYLRAREQWAKRTPDSIRTAIRMYGEASSIDPNFALAYAGLADSYSITHSGLPARTRYPLAKAAAERAVELDDNSPEAHTALAFMRYKFEWRWADAEAEFQRAAALGPRYALGRHWYADFLYLTGRDTESIARFNEALALDPFSIAIRRDMVRPLIHSGRIQDARSVLEKGMVTSPGDPQLLIAMADVLDAEGKPDAAVEMRLQGLISDGVAVPEADALRAAYKTGGARAMTAVYIVQYRKRFEQSVPNAATKLAQLYGRLGDATQAIAWLKTAIDLNEDAAIQLRTQPAFDALRKDARFVALLERVGLGLPSKF